MAARLNAMPSALNDRVGASDGTPFDFALATGPAWPIWAETLAPVL